jgi:hypothetical protein
MLLFCIFVCVHENVVNCKAIEGADYVKSSCVYSTSDTVCRCLKCALPYSTKRHMLLYMIVLSIIIIFQCDHPVLSFDTHIYTFTHLIIYTTSYKNRKSVTFLWCSYYVYCIICKILSLNVA